MLEAGARIAPGAPGHGGSARTACVLLRLGELVANIGPEQFLLRVVVVHGVDPVIVRVNDGSHDEHFALDSFRKFERGGRGLRVGIGSWQTAVRCSGVRCVAVEALVLGLLQVAQGPRILAVLLHFVFYYAKIEIDLVVGYEIMISARTRLRAIDAIEVDLANGLGRRGGGGLPRALVQVVYYLLRQLLRVERKENQLEVCLQFSQRLYAFVSQDQLLGA